MLRSVLEIGATAWRQLSHSRVRMMVAVSGVVVAVMLMLVQLGFMEAAYASSLGVPRRITADIVLITMSRPIPFPRVQFVRVSGQPDVERMQALSIGTAKLRNPWTKVEHPILVFGLEPTDSLINLAGFNNQSVELREPDVIVFDSSSRPVFGPIAKSVADGNAIEVELNRRKVRVIATTRVGIAIGVDGNLFTTDTNFQRIFPERIYGAIDLGLVKLRPGADAARACREIQQIVGNDVLAMTHADFLVFEAHFLRDNAPIDFIFGLGAAIGLFVGFVIVYQILYTDVSNHLPQYATLKAIGFTDFYLLRLVLIEALLLAVIGFLPGTALSLAIYRVASNATSLPLEMTAARLLFVLSLTVGMCATAAAIAIRRLRAADPADVF